MKIEATPAEFLELVRQHSPSAFAGVDPRVAQEQATAAINALAQQQQVASPAR